MSTMTADEIGRAKKTLFLRMEDRLMTAKRFNGGKLSPVERELHKRDEAEFDRLEAMQMPGRRTQDDLSCFQAEERKRAGAKSGQSGQPLAISTSTQRRLFAEMFPGEQLDSAGFDSPAEFFRLIGGGHTHDHRLQSLAMGEFSDPAGGFAIPTEYAAGILDASLESEIVRPRARIQPMVSSEINVPRWDGSDHSAGLLFGGMRARWTAEADTPGESTGKLQQMSLHAKNLFLYLKASNQLLADAPQFDANLESAIAGSVGFQLDDAFLNGTGVGMPLGALKDPASIVVNKESGQAADTVVYENLTKMFARMWPSGRTRAIWIANSTLIPSLLTLTIAVGTGGSHIPVMTESNGQLYISTRPGLFTEKVPAAGDQGDVSFIDFTQYVVGLRADMRLDRSVHVGFATDETAFRAIVRADGRGSWKEPLTPLRGQTVSWCVTLESR